MSADQTEYEIFISYARLDNTPIPPDYPLGWVTAVRDHILADQRRYSTEPLRIFFDTDEIKDIDDWRHRILGGLRHSKILLVCLSPNYFKSGPCQWEWDEYLQRATHHLIGADTVATVYFVEVPGSDEQENAKRLAELMRGNFTDLRPWFPAGARMVQEAEVKRRLDALGLSLYERIERARRARGVPGNVRRTNPFFVGRREELRKLHEQLGVGAIGVVTAVHGLGGQGKTELAYHYANGFADWYPGGLWSLRAEGKNALLPLLGDLAFVPQFGYTPSDAEKADANRLGMAVLEELRKRCERLSEPEPPARAGRAALVILDNVSEPELLGAAQLADLPHPANWLRIVATTRLGPERLAKSGKQLATVPVDSLDEDDALALMRDHQPAGQFPSAAEEAAARQIVRDLGGFTLAVEQAAIYLGLNAEHDPPSAFLARLRRDGLPSVDSLPRDADIAAQMLHQQKQLGPILRATLEPLVQELPAAGTALEFAAMLPPDSVPWPWLKELTAARHPDLTDIEWGKIKRRLEGTRFLTSGDAPEIARVHRLVAAHLRDGSSPSASENLFAFVSRRADAMYLDQHAPADWQLDAFLTAIPHLLVARLDRDLANDGMFLAEKIASYRTLPVAGKFLAATHATIQRLAESDPGNAVWQRDLSVSLDKLGNLAVAQGNLPEAQRLFADSLRIRQRLAESDPGNAASQRDLWVSLIKVGDLALAKGNLPEAQRLFADGLRIAQRLAESDPGNAAWQCDLAQSHCWVGIVLQQQGDLGRARQSFTSYRNTLQRLAESDPGNAEWQRELSVSLLRLGNLAVAQENLPEAQRLFAESLRIIQRLAESDPGNAEWQRDLSVALYKLGYLAVAQGNLPEAQRLFAEDLRIAQRLAESDPSNAAWQFDLTVSTTKVGEMLARTGKRRRH